MSRTSGRVPGRPTRQGEGLGRVVIHLAISYVGLWAAMVPLWLDPRGLAAPYASVLILLGLFAPALAAFLVTRKRHRWWRGLGLSWGVRRSAVLRYAAVGVGITVGWIALAWLVAGYLGFGGFDPAMPGTEAVLGVTGAGPVAFWIAVPLAMVAGSTVGALLVVASEIGWRGWLVPALLPRGRGFACVISGLAWAGWQIPLLLLGLHYPGSPRPLALVIMIIFSVGFGTVLAWLRIRSGSVLPAAMTVGVMLAMVSLTGVFGREGELDWALTSPMGLVGFVVLLPIVASVLRQSWQPTSR